MRLGLTLVCLAFLGCGRFNLPLTTTYRLLVADSGSGAVRVFSINSTTGAISNLNTPISVTSPTKVIAHPSSGAFWVYKNNASLECYQYNFRSGTGPTLGSSTEVPGVIDDLQAAADGSSITYSKNSDSNIYWRSVSDCTLGSETAVAAPGKTSTVRLAQDSSGSTVVASEISGTYTYKFSRSSSGALTYVSRASVTGQSTLPAVTPDGTYVVVNSGGSDLTTISLANMTSTQTIGLAGTFIVYFAISNTRMLALRQGVTHLPVTLSSSGVPSAGSFFDFGITNFLGGFAALPSRTLFYTGDQTNDSVWAHVVRDSTPYVNTPVEYSVGGTPDSIAVLAYRQRL